MSQEEVGCKIVTNTKRRKIKMTPKPKVSKKHEASSVNNALVCPENTMRSSKAVSSDVDPDASADARADAGADADARCRARRIVSCRVV